MARRKPAGANRNRKPSATGPTAPAAGVVTPHHGTGDPPPAPKAGTKPGTKAGTSEAVEPEALVVSYRFDSGIDGEPYAATVRLTGRRVGVRGQPRAGRDTFTHEETIARVVPGSGPVSISAWVYGLEPGEWTVAAELIRPPGYTADGQPPPSWRRTRAEPISRAAWSWRRWSLTPAPDAPVRTRWAVPAPLARIPGVIPGSFTILAVLGMVVALAVQSSILAGEGVSVGASLLVSLLALVVGLLGAKLWYAALHPGESLLRPGWAVDGFLVVAPVVALAGLLALDVPVGLFLDATAPSLFLAVAIGRLGCFFTGCCAGRPTRSRWGVWSSDRRVGARRIPTQLIESASGALIALASAALVLAGPFSGQGLIFLGALAAYFVVRQVLLRLRAEPRRFLWLRRAAA